MLGSYISLKDVMHLFSSSEAGLDRLRLFHYLGITHPKSQSLDCKLLWPKKKSHHNIYLIMYLSAFPFLLCFHSLAVPLVLMRIAEITPENLLAPFVSIQVVWKVYTSIRDECERKNLHKTW